ncbi:GDYXXLXY domain-containing protein [Nostocoides sp. F2B08]|uniref:GDYXXLXY domain-containing protein n=1 Tax=Nostocoides sp. F2B08 TaxID=2653936 RepID=UPI00186B2313|nr:GDYXXLXY domain-containing protein [Tetrasphaera sp. F2B08]
MTTAQNTTEQPRSDGARSGGARPARGPGRRGWLILVGVLVVQLVLTLVAVLPQLSPRVSGTEVALRVGPVDPIDPFRGAYVDLDYPDLPDPQFEASGPEERGTAYVALRQEGDVWVGGEVQRNEPDGLFLRCDDSGWRLECGIESWFVGQSEAVDLEESVLDQDAIATVRVDRWGNAAIVDLIPHEG